MTIKYVQFMDGTETVVMTVFSCSQDPTNRPNQGEIEEDDPRWQDWLTSREMSTADIAAARIAEFMAVAALAIAPLQDAVDLDEATPEESALLTRWKQYRVALNRLSQQSGYPDEIDWPLSPAD